PGGRHVFWAEALLLAPHRSTSGYARRSRLASGQNPLPRMYSYFGDTTLLEEAVDSDAQHTERSLVFQTFVCFVQFLQRELRGFVEAFVVHEFADGTLAPVDLFENLFEIGHCGGGFIVKLFV